MGSIRPVLKTISIIICSRNRAEYLRKTLEALNRVLPVDSSHIEIIVVDNGSTDSTRHVISEFAATRANVKYVFEPEQGHSVALNHGARKATGDILVWIDDDVIPRSNWLENLTRPLIEGRYGAVAGRVLIAPHLIRDWMTPKHRSLLAEVLESKRRDGICSMVGANMATTRAIFAKTGGYDSELGPGRLGYQADSLLTDHLVSVGARTGFVEDAEVEHHFDPARLRRKSWLKASEQRGRSSAYVSYHWYHSTFPLASLRQLRKQAQLTVWRLLHRPDLDPESEGISIDEMAYVQQIAFFDQYRIVCQRLRLYDKRGWIKKA
jgi:glycosyltransferase involved in cell wall biosynthesis